MITAFYVILGLAVLLLVVLNFAAIFRLEKLLGKNKGWFRLRNLLLAYFLIGLLWFLISFVGYLGNVLSSGGSILIIINYILSFLSLFLLIVYWVYIIYLIVKGACLPWWWVILVLVPFVGTILFIYVMYKLVKNFGLSGWWTILVVILFPIFFPYIIFKGNYQNCGQLLEKESNNQNDL